MDAATLIGALVARRAAIEAEIKGQVDELQAIDRLIAHYDLRPPAAARDTPDALPSTLGGGPVVIPDEAVSGGAAGLVPGDGCAVAGGEPETVADSPANRPGFLPRPKKAADVGNLVLWVARELASSRKETSTIAKALGLKWKEVSDVLKPHSRLGSGPEYFDTNADGWALTPLGREALLP